MRQAAEACAYFKRHSSDDARQSSLDGVWVAGAAVLAEREASRPRPEWVAKQDDRGRWYAARQDGCTALTYIYGLAEAQARAVAKALNELEP
jgi:hypothetical protein